MAHYVYCGDDIVWNGYGDVEVGALLRLPSEFGIGRLGESNAMYDRITVGRSDARRLERVLTESRFEDAVHGRAEKTSDFELLYMMSAILYYMNQHPDREVFDLCGEAY